MNNENIEKTNRQVKDDFKGVADKVGKTAQTTLEDGKSVASTLSTGARAVAQDVTDHVRTATNQVNESLQQGAKDMGAALKQCSGQAVDKLSDFGSKAYKQACATTSKVSKGLRTEMQQSPLLCLGIAFGTGALLTSVLGRRGQQRL